MKKNTFIVSALVMAFGAFALVGCEDSSGGASGAVGGEPSVKLWSATNLDKIMRDDVIENTTPAALNFELCQNEVEGAQFLITPQDGYKVGSFEVEISDLKSPNGDVIKKDALKIYLEKYINVTNKMGPNPLLHAGYIPDALLPFDVAVEYGENRVEGVNQSIYVTLETQTETPAGTYTGECTVDVDGTEFVIPVRATVWDFAISEEVHIQSLFQIWQDELMNGELDSSDEMYRVYYDKLAEYRISATNLLADTQEEFIEEAKKATENPKISAFALPYTSVYVSGVGMDINYGEVKSYLKNMILESTEEVFLLDKLVYYFGALIDEPQYTQSYDIAKRIFVGVNALEEELLSELEEEGYFSDKTEEYRKRVEDTLLNIPNLLTTYYTPEYFEDDELTYCPLFNELDGEENMAQYQKLKEANGSLWWYGCMGPCHPYPSYHQDDNLLGARILGIMQYDYDIDGNLYWAVNCYSKQTAGTGDLLRPADPYVDAPRWFPDWPTNGEGYLFYPGLDYGMDEPVVSLRLEAIRDGNEDYEYLYKLNQLTQGLSEYYDMEITTDGMVSNLYDRIYHGVQYVPDNENFLQVRRELAAIIERCGMDNKLVINGIRYSGDSATIEFLAADGYTAIVNGQNIEGKEQGKGRKYSYTIRMNEASNYFDISLQGNGETYETSVLAGGKTAVYSSVDTEAETEKLIPNDSAVQISFNEDSNFSVSGGSAKMYIESKFDPENPLATLTYNPQVSLDISAAQIDPMNLNSFIFEIYNDSDIDVDMRVKLKAPGSEYQLATYSLKKGQWTSIRLEGIYLTNWASLSKTQYIVLEFNNTVSNANKEGMPPQTLYLDDIIYSERTA